MTNDLWLLSPKTDLHKTQHFISYGIITNHQSKTSQGSPNILIPLEKPPRSLAQAV